MIWSLETEEVEEAEPEDTEQLEEEVGGDEIWLKMMYCRFYVNTFCSVQ